LAGAIAGLKRAKKLPAKIADRLADAHSLYADIQSLLRLTIDESFDPETAPAALKSLLATAADAVDFSALEAKLAATTTDIRTLLAERLPGAL